VQDENMQNGVKHSHKYKGGWASSSRTPKSYNHRRRAAVGIPVSSFVLDFASP